MKRIPALIVSLLAPLPCLVVNAFDFKDLKIEEKCLNSPLDSIPGKIGQIDVEIRRRTGDIFTTQKSAEIQTADKALKFCDLVLPANFWQFPPKEKLSWPSNSCGWDYVRSGEIKYQCNSAGAVDFNDKCEGPCNVVCLFKKSLPQKILSRLAPKSPFDFQITGSSETKRIGRVGQQIYFINNGKKILLLNKVSSASFVPPQETALFAESDGKKVVLWNPKLPSRLKIVLGDSATQIPELGYKLPNYAYNFVSWNRDGSAVWLEICSDSECEGILRLDQSSASFFRPPAGAYTKVGDNYEVYDKACNRIAVF